MNFSIQSSCTVRFLICTENERRAKWDASSHNSIRSAKLHPLAIAAKGDNMTGRKLQIVLILSVYRKPICWSETAVSGVRVR
jgi:hypothetical protein